MFAHHSLLLSFLMAIEFDRSDGILTEQEINFFVNGTKVIHKPQQSPIFWISDKVISFVTYLSWSYL